MIKHLWIVFSQGVATDVLLQKPDPRVWSDSMHILIFDPASLSVFKRLCEIEGNGFFDTVKNIANAVNAGEQFTPGIHNLALCAYTYKEAEGNHISVLSLESKEVLTHLDDVPVLECYGIHMPAEIKELFTGTALFCMFSEIATQAYERRNSKH